MNSKTTLAALTVLAGATLCTGAVLAHEEHDAGKASAPAKQEQKPWGIAGDPKAARRTIEIAMSDDMRFTPSNIDVRQGETVKFVVRNRGKVLHEMVIGDRKTLDEHAALMVRFPGMEHDEPYMAHVAAGSQASLVWTFNRPGDFDFACLIAGHYQAGMVGKIKVSAAR
ncbi:MAG TPA: cupredoxin family protein [Ramlibacter sp.]